MSAREGQIPSDRYLDMVKNGIERCMQNYMNKRETVNALLIQYKIEPWFTELVWGRLENENPEFFKAYYAKLLVKDQIMQFNRLLSEQVERMRQSTITGRTPHLTSNESHILSTQQIPTPISAQSTRPLRGEDMQQQQNAFCNNVSSIPPWQLSDWNIHTRKNEVSPDMFLAQNRNERLAQTMNVQTVRPENAGRSLFNFRPPTSMRESHPSLTADASVPRFSSVDPNPQDLHSFLFDLERLQQNFLPELPMADCNDLQGGYSRPHFQTMDANNFMDLHHRRH
ncbi:Angiotensin-converting enzyme 2 [Handroanthus impetiginosus]|uniref:Angiotensin-converting enzyme 2 n=1 Tax=Handroanthus impetiginosus TaxID=429701 RepID=A0A2G9GMC8_9LAMI|nr:Angiotensin-converting enzyme 2 [Handroanthus impetiginosus]